VEAGSLADLRHLTRTTVVAELSGDPSSLRSLPGVHELQIQDHKVELEVETDRIGDLVAGLAPLQVRSLVSHPPTLEELFMRHYEDGEVQE
jgi:ABC-2 type transport system ATP-binding protein